MFKPTLENKILGLVIVAIGISLTTFVYLDIQQQTESLLEQNQSKVDVLASSIVISIQNIMLSGKGDFAHDLVENMRKIDEVEKLQVFNKQGEEAFVQQQSSLQDTEQRPRLLKVVQSGQSLQFHEIKDGRELLTRLEPLFNDTPCQRCHGSDEPIRGIVSVSTSMEEVKEQIRNTQLRMLVTSLIAFAAITIALRILIRMAIVNPLGTIVAAMKEIAQGNLTKMVRRSSKDEIGDLVDNFNLMTQNLRESQESLQRSNEELEDNSRQLMVLNLELQHRLEEVSALSAIAAAISHSFDLTSTLDAALTEILEILQAQEGDIYLLDEENGDLLLQVSQAAPGEQGNVLSGEALSKVIRRVAEVKEPLIVGAEEASNGSGRIQSIAAVPLQSKDRLLGIMSVLASGGNRITADKIGLMLAIGNQLGVAIENARLFQEASEVKVLRELDALKSEFVARASHELRTPVTSIKGFAEILLRDDIKLTPELRREFVEGINRTSDRLTRLIQDLLNLSRIEAGRMEVAKEAVVLRPVVRDVIQQFRHQNPRHSFAIDLARDLPRILADRERLGDVLTNLVSNAVVYSPDGGQIAIRARVEGDDMVVSVSDRGVGIPPEELQHLFRRYYRVDSISTRPVGGTGLGLYISKTYLEAMGGRIWVDSKLGEGSTFSFSLPLAKVEG